MGPAYRECLKHLKGILPAGQWADLYQMSHAAETCDIDALDWTMIFGIMRIMKLQTLVLVILMCACGQGSENHGTGKVEIVEQIEVDSVWVANRVWFDLHTIGNRQFVAYYDKDRMMTVASREIGSRKWVRKTIFILAGTCIHTRWPIFVQVRNLWQWQYIDQPVKA